MDVEEMKLLYPDEYAAAKYEKEIAHWQEKYDEANEKHDWSTRNWAGCQLMIKKEKLAELQAKLHAKKKKKIKIKL